MTLFSQGTINFWWPIALIVMTVRHPREIKSKFKELRRYGTI